MIRSHSTHALDGRVFSPWDARFGANPEHAALVLAAYAGPDALPAEIVTDAYFDGIFAA